MITGSNPPDINRFQMNKRKNILVFIEDKKMSNLNDSKFVRPKELKAYKGQQKYIDYLIIFIIVVNFHPFDLCIFNTI